MWDMQDGAFRGTFNDRPACPAAGPRPPPPLRLPRDPLTRQSVPFSVLIVLVSFLFSDVALLSGDWKNVPPAPRYALQYLEPSRLGACPSSTSLPRPFHGVRYSREAWVPFFA